jgi:hypothetical protein
MGGVEGQIWCALEAVRKPSPCGPMTWSSGQTCALWRRAPQCECFELGVAGSGADL